MANTHNNNLKRFLNDASKAAGDPNVKVALSWTRFDGTTPKLYVTHVVPLDALVTEVTAQGNWGTRTVSVTLRFDRTLEEAGDTYKQVLVTLIKGSGLAQETLTYYI